MRVSLAADVAVICRQLGTNLVIPGGARVIEAKGRLIIPGINSDALNCQWLSSVVYSLDVCRSVSLSITDKVVRTCL